MTNGRILIGLVLIAIGVGLILEIQNVWDFGQVVSDWWPLVFVAIGLLQLATRSAPAFVGVGFLIAGLWVLSAKHDWLDGYGRYVWPGILILVGLLFLLRAGKGSWGDRDDRRGGRGKERRSRHEPTILGGGKDVTDEDRVSRTVIFGGYEGRATSKSFRGGSLTACFGGIELDLRDAGLPPEGARIDATACFGGVEIKVPKGWRVQVSGLPLFGGLANKSDSGGSGPLLEVKGTAMFGGVEVKQA